MAGPNHTPKDGPDPRWPVPKDDPPGAVCRLCGDQLINKEGTICGGCRQDRLMIAALAMNGLLGRTGLTTGRAKEAVRLAEALIVELNKEK